MGENNKLMPDFRVLDPCDRYNSRHGEQDMKKSVTEPRAELQPRSWKGSNQQFSKKYFSKFLISSTGQPRRLMPAKIADRWRFGLPIKNLRAHNNSNFFVNAYKHV